MTRSRSPKKHVPSLVKGAGPRPTAFGSAVNPSKTVTAKSAPNPVPAPRMGRGVTQLGQPSPAPGQQSVMGPGRGWMSTSRRPGAPTG